MKKNFILSVPNKLRWLWKIDLCKIYCLLYLLTIKFIGSTLLLSNKLYLVNHLSEIGCLLIFKSKILSLWYRPVQWFCLFIEAYEFL